MTAPRPVGRPVLSDADAWRSARERFNQHAKEVPGKDCYAWGGPRTIHLAGKRGVISPTNFALAEAGHDLKKIVVLQRTCGTRTCLWPEHISVMDMDNPYASWAPFPVPE